MRARLLATVGLGCAILASCSGDPRATVESSAGALKGGTTDPTATSVVGVINTHPTFASTCTGSLLAPNLVLVSRSCVSALKGGGAASCAASFFDPPDGSLDVTTGTDIAADASATIHVSEIIVAPDDHVCGNDLALLILASSVPASTATPLIPRLDVPPTKDEVYTAIGYGAVDGAGHDSGVRRALTARKVLCVTGCDAFAVTEGKEIAGDEGPCTGDNGSPAIDASGMVFAISSRGSGDCSSGLYTRLDAFSALLKSTALSAATKGGYAAPGWATAPSDAGTDAVTDTAAIDSAIADAADTTPFDGDDGGFGAPPAAAPESSGCGCAVVAPRSTSFGALLGLAFALLLVRRRR